MSQKKKALYVPGRRNSDAAISSLNLYDLIKAHYRSPWDHVDDALAGIRSMPLDALMHGMPPAGGDLVKDFHLWEGEIRLEVEAYASQPRRFLCEAAQDPSFESFDAARAAIGNQPWVADEHALRLDFFASLFGDVEAARRVEDVFGPKPGLMSAFARALSAHARVNARRVVVFRPAIGMSLLMSAARMEFEAFRRAAAAFNDVVVWEAHRRKEDGDAAEDAIRQRRDNLALDAVDRGSAVVDEQIEENRRIRMIAKEHEEREQDQDAAGRRMVAGAFAAFKARRAAGEQSSDEDVRAAADEILCRAEIEEDRKIPIDIENVEVARMVVENRIVFEEREIQDFAKAALSDPDKLGMLGGNLIDEERKVAILAAGGVALTKALMDMCKVSDEAFCKNVQALFQAKFVAAVPEDAVNDAEAERERQYAKDRAEEDEALRIAAEKLAARKVYVLDAVDTSGMSKERGDLLEQVRHLGATPLELADVGDLVGVRKALVADYPHASEIIDRLLGELVDDEPFKLRPTLLVGSPGAGKTSLLVEMAALLEIPRLVYPCAGVCDSSFVGTSAQWGTKRISIPLELIRTSGIPNPLVVLDEIEKAGQYSNGGRLVDGLLPLLEAHSASEFFEVGIEKKARLQHVSYAATANSLDGIPAPLRDRMRILRMPDPGPEHVGDLVRGIVGRIRSERGLDRRWVPDLAPDEEAVVRKAWAGGSLRRLRRAVDATLDTRDRALFGRPM